jgi:hypothetical protein
MREKSLEAFKMALQIRKTLNDYAGVIETLSEIAQHHATFRDFYTHKEILEAQQAAIDLGRELFGPDDPILINVYNNIGLTHLGRDELDHALENLRHASNIKYAGIIDSSARVTHPLFHIPSVTRITNPTFHDVQILQNIGYACLKQYEATRDTQMLDASIRYYITGDSIIEILKSQLLNGVSRKQLIDEAGDFYINASNAAMSSYLQTSPGKRMQRIQRLFMFVEKSRNWSLIDRYMQSDRNARIRENTVLSRISDLRAQLPGVYTKEALPATDSLHRLVDVLIEQLKSSYPEYFRFLYNPGIASAGDIQAFCKANKLHWLHYVNLTDDRFATILFTPDTVVVSSVLSSDSIEFHRAGIMQSMTRRDWKFTSSAHALYKLLFSEHAALLKPGTLYISSAGYLDNIPFDILLTSPAAHLPLEDVAQHYLIQQFSITLIPSGTFGMTIWEPSVMINESVFIAPDYIGQSLQHSAAEAQVGSKLMNGTYVAGTPDKEVALAWLRETSPACEFHSGHRFQPRLCP